MIIISGIFYTFVEKDENKRLQAIAGMATGNGYCG